jgi:aryl-alcohol dehydrogenase-like predicted oxidoreductase
MIRGDKKYMKTITLGRTSLQVTVAGLGCGGFSRLGLEKRGVDHAASIVRTAYDEGINFFDTATLYGTQVAVGKGLSEIPRDKYVLSTKFLYKGKSPDDLRKSLEESLRELKTDYVDIYHLHGVTPVDYPFIRDTFVPIMQKIKQEGKIRFLGVTENFSQDTSHNMFKTLLPEDLFDVIMVGYNILNPSARKTILPLAQEKKVGVLCMYAVRAARANPKQLKIDIGRILEHGQADPAIVKIDNTIDFLIEKKVVHSIMEAAYRFCRHTQGIHVVLTGTSDSAHLKENIASILKAKLPEDVLNKLDEMFGRVDCVNGQ